MIVKIALEAIEEFSGNTLPRRSKSLGFSNLSKSKIEPGNYSSGGLSETKRKPIGGSLRR